MGHCFAAGGDGIERGWSIGVVSYDILLTPLRGVATLGNE